MNSSNWHKEIEKKYKLSFSDVKVIREKLLSLGFRKISYTKQKDWAPDFSGFLLRVAGILLRIRYQVYLSGQGPVWYLTLKQKLSGGNIRVNKEFECSATEIEHLREAENVLMHQIGKKIELLRVIEDDQKYILSIGLTEKRMILEKKRELWRLDELGVSIALDELPAPLGYFMELEVLSNPKELARVEKLLNLEAFQVEPRDYGELVKDRVGKRELVFSETEPR